MIYLILFPVAGICLLIAGAIVFRHWKEIRLLNPQSIAEERERQKREELLMQRLSRMRLEKIAPFKAIVNRAIFIVKTAYHGVYVRLVKLEKFYKQAKSPFAVMAPSVKDRIKVIIDDARSLVRNMKWADAERRYLEALSIDPHNFDAYKGLGTIYLKQKLYPQAIETFEFILKSKKADDMTYAALAEIAEFEGKMAKAEEMRLKAVEFRPRLANRHYELAQFYHDRKQPQKAWLPIKKSTELEPKSAKYLEISLETAILLGDRAEATRRYDKMRLLTEDRQKLHNLKERIDGMGK